ncbi:MAG: class I SAM-dependent methyltransferase [Clostridia bacterium]|nr:class I SAM-dependent methyltransferase [Clostridia bacterium]
MDIVNSSRCPYCNSLAIEEIFRTILPTIMNACSRDEALSSHLYPCKVFFCSSCGLGFNASPLPQETLDSIYLHYRDIKPQRGIGASKFKPFLNMVQKNVITSDFIVEIGSSDGYLLDRLVELGYFNIEGIEPSKEWQQMNNKNKIRNVFFTEDTEFHCSVDVFLLMHVLEHFERPWALLSAMRNKLSKHGKVIFEVPHFTSFFHQHLSFFSIPFVCRLARDIGFEVCDLKDDGFVFRCCLQKNKIKSQGNSKNQLSKNECAEVLEIVKRDALHNNSVLQDLRDLLCVKKSLYWWGTGTTSIIALSNLGEDVFLEKEIIFLDNDIERVGLVVPIPFLQHSPIQSPGNVLSKITCNDAVVVASDFASEIVQQMHSSGVFPNIIYSFVWK